MKNTFKITACAALLAVAGACSDSFLERKPKGEMGEAQFTSVAGVEGLLVGAYGLMNGNVSGTWGNYSSAPSQWVFGEVAADNAHKGSEKNDQATLFELEMHTALPVNEHLAGMWRNYYEGIARCNFTLNMLGTVQAGSGEKFSTARETEIKAEARMLRAHYYFYLWRVFKNIPWIDETVDKDKAVSVPNDVDVLPKIVDDLVFAEANLPATDKPLKEAGRVDRIAAKAYLAKVYLYQKDYAKALPLFNEVITDRPALATLPFEDNFDIKKENGPESIFAAQHAINPDGGGTNANVGDMLGGIHGTSPTGCCGFFNPSVDLVNAFKVDATGLPLAKTAYRTNPFKSDLDYPIVNGPGDTTFYSLDNTLRFDPRLDHTVGRTGVQYRDWGTFVKGWLRAPAFGGPFVGQKHMIDKADFPGNVQAGVNYVTGLNVNIIRLADVYLMAAECEAQTGNLARALTLVNAVRNRAATVAKKKDGNGADAADYDVKPYASFADAADAMEKIKTERRLELALEGHRFFDLVRWGDAKAVLEDYHNNFEGLKSVLNVDYAGFSFDPAKNTIFPIPQEQIDRTGSVLNQNP